ncbi:hypothetical protein [Streptomyces sp. TLI_105]|uniref:hypothetical protein n=1 Tax=Streptomyces sp. TLI_105 TaxID=1881019 RepID=UPI00089A692A|nr:hypothetical protein [Streptomyces sp. TLI_105]SEC87165.1 hypothetical protein SAMN05428939_3503 [Streptomyces sp. TLI_105]
MRLRHSVAAVCGALALTAALASPAHAATGDFSYRFVGITGAQEWIALHDPASGECITIAEAADPDASEPAFAPHNDTDEYAMVFTGTDCSGDSWTLRPHGRPASDRLKLRSVMFFQP